MTSNELREHIRLMIQPVDLEGLIAQGVLAKAGAWYRIMNMKKLPKSVSMHISEISRDSQGRAKIKFAKVSDRQAVSLRKFL